jgi:S-ribosylhomocysteine lyase
MMERIQSFCVDHDYIGEGIYVSRIDGDVTTYDMRTRRPNNPEGDYMDNLTMHSLEHMFATYIRNSNIGGDVIYFGPMGCRTGFYLLVRNADNGVVLSAVMDTLKKIVWHSGEMFGASRKECGNYKELDLAAAKAEAVRYLSVLTDAKNDFVYPKGDE